jgi:geranylgeranyl diphosphate synthase type 3
MLTGLLQMNAAKGYCDDLQEGKFSFPIIHAIHSSPSDNSEILNILKLHTNDATIKAHAVNYMENTTRSFGYTKEVLECLRTQVVGMINAIDGGNPALELLVDRILAD